MSHSLRSFLCGSLFIAVLPLAGWSQASGAAARAGLPDAMPAPVVVTVDHFFATSANAGQLFSLFHDTLGLPVSWPFTRYGDFASGGISLGNVVFEFVLDKPPGGAARPAKFGSLAFEPAGDTAAALIGLAQRGISHGEPERVVTQDAAGRPLGWTNTTLPGLVPPWVAFVCDYHDRPMVTANHREAGAELVRRAGGALGAVRLREIVVGVKDLDAARQAWRKLLATPAAETDGVFAFGPGPGIRLVKAERPGISRIVWQVASLKKAAAFLAEHQMLSEGKDGGVAIAPSALDGLQVVLVEN